MSLAFVFPGQGSQSVGMLTELAEAEPQVRDTFDQASNVLGYDLWELCQNGPVEDLNATERTQPAMLSAGVAVWRVWREKGGPSPTVMSGHSLGEFTALVCADSLDFETAVDLVRYRGEIMQEAVPMGEGAMAAILGLGDDEVTEACKSAAGPDVVEPVNFNAPGQVVIAGNSAAVDRAIVIARDKGAKRAIRLPVSVPSHSSLMQPAAKIFGERLKRTHVRTPLVPEIYTVDVRKHRSPDGIRDALVEQLFKPVRWSETVRTMISQGVNAIVECGPGKVLTGINRRIERRKEIRVFALHDPATFEVTLPACWESLDA